MALRSSRCGLSLFTPSITLVPVVPGGLFCPSFCRVVCWRGRAEFFCREDLPAWRHRIVCLGTAGARCPIGKRRVDANRASSDGVQRVVHHDTERGHAYLDEQQITFLQSLRQQLDARWWALLSHVTCEPKRLDELGRGV